MEKKVWFYSFYERIWHWVQAIAVLVLIMSGFEISYAGNFSVTGFKVAVTLHNLAGVILVVNAFLALFYNLAGGLLKRYVPGLEDFFTLGIRHATYYIWGIFVGAPHPFDKTPEKRLLPLQKITYFMILNVLLPLMIVTGALKLSAEVNPAWVEYFGGLKLLGPIHRFGAWMFAAFLIVHVYMITTGHTIFSNLKAMVLGYEEVHLDDGKEG